MMVNLKKYLLWIGLGLIVLIILVVFVFRFSTDLKIQVLSALNLILIFGYVVTTYYLVSVNEKLVCIQNTPIVTAEMRSQLELLEQVRLQQGKKLTEAEKNNMENKNTTKLILHNPSKNHAMDTRITITAYVNEKRINSSPPLDGTRDWHIQAGHSVIKAFKIEEDYLSSANCTIQNMAEETTEANKEKQFILKLKISYSDGCEKRIDNPDLCWYFGFQEMKWTFII